MDITSSVKTDHSQLLIFQYSVQHLDAGKGIKEVSFRPSLVLMKSLIKENRKKSILCSTGSMKFQVSVFRHYDVAFKANFTGGK